MPASLLLKSGFWLSAAVIAVLSLLPVALLPPQAFDIWDKAQHAGGFAVLALLGHMAYRDHPLRTSLGLLVYGAGIELAQTATGWRYGDVLDFLADAVGIALGTGAAALIRWFKLAARRQ